MIKGERRANKKRRSTDVVSYDPDGNMLSNGTLTCTYDSANRLLSAGGHTYTYNAESVRIRNLCTEEDTTYTYNTNAKLSMLLMKTADSTILRFNRIYIIYRIGFEIHFQRGFYFNPDTPWRH